MGCWGTDVFDGDEPRDYLNHVIYRFEQEIEMVLRGELPELASLLGFQPGANTLDSCLVPTLAIIRALHETLECEYLPAPETVLRWREHCLLMFDESDVWDIPESKADRRQVIEKLLEQLLRLCEEKKRAL